MEVDNMENIKINGNQFLKYMQDKEIINLNPIKSIKFNKKSITVKIADKQFFFNDIFNKKELYNLIIAYLFIYLDNSVIYDKDYLKDKYKKLIIKEV